MIVEQLSAIVRASFHIKGKTPSADWINPYHLVESTPDTNQFAIFLKPETTELHKGVKFKELLAYLIETFEKWSVEVGAIRILPSEYLARHQIMDLHYGVINKISRHGLHAISAKARKTLKQEYGEDIESRAQIMGGHQFIARFPKFSAFALATLSDNIGVKKLGSGTYCVKVQVGGQPFVVLNAFHPFQLEHFTTGDKAIVVLEGRSKTAWSDLRREMLGATNPAYAFQGSIRQTFHSRAEEWGLVNVSQSANGIHLSAGPLEGMIELQRFFSSLDEKRTLTAEQTTFGKMLLDGGMPQALLQTLQDNPTVEYQGHAITVFDLTEEIDAPDAAARLLGCQTMLAE